MLCNCADRDHADHWREHIDDPVASSGDDENENDADDDYGGNADSDDDNDEDDDGSKSTRHRNRRSKATENGRNGKGHHRQHQQHRPRTAKSGLGSYPSASTATLDADAQSICSTATMRPRTAASGAAGGAGGQRRDRMADASEVPTDPQAAALDNYVRALSDPRTGLPLSTKRVRLSTYRNCFAGSEGAAWFMANMENVRTLEEARDVGQNLIDLGVRCYYYSKLNF